MIDPVTVVEWSLLQLLSGRLGFDPERIEMLGSVSVNHSLTRPRCKIGTSKCGVDRNQGVPSLCGMFGGNTVPIHLNVMAYTKVG